MCPAVSGYRRPCQVFTAVSQAADHPALRHSSKHSSAKEVQGMHCSQLATSQLHDM